MRRDKSDVDLESDIDEFIHLARRWNTLHERFSMLYRGCLKMLSIHITKCFFSCGSKSNYTSESDQQALYDNFKKNRLGISDSS